MFSFSSASFRIGSQTVEQASAISLVIKDATCRYDLKFPGACIALKASLCCCQLKEVG